MADQIAQAQIAQSTGAPDAPTGAEGAPLPGETLTEGLSLSQQALAYFQDGGPILWLLLAISVVALTIILGKLFQFLWVRLSGRGFVEPALESLGQGDPHQALAVLQGRSSPIARVMATAVQGAAGGTHNEEQAKEEVTRVAGLELDNLRSGLRLLALIATLSPLLGLLGTVLGMIDAFRALEAAGNRVDPAILSGGIWVALLTTAAGLIVAIPAAAAHNWLEGMVYRMRRGMEDAATRVREQAGTRPRGGIIALAFVEDVTVVIDGSGCSVADEATVNVGDDTIII